MGQAGKKTHTLWFSHFLKRDNFLFLFLGGVLACAFWVHMSLSPSAPALVGLLALILFFPLSIYLYGQAKYVQRRFNEIISEENIVLKGLFADEAKFKAFVTKTRDMVFNKKEYYIVFGVPICLGIFSTNLFLDFVRGKLDFSFLHTTPPFLIVENLYSTLYWAFVFTVVLSLVWLILGITSALYSLGTEKNNLAVSKAIRRFRETLQKPAGSVRSEDFVAMDMSFGRFKDGLAPLANFVFTLSVKIALVGLFYSIPAVANYLITRDFAVVWYSLCVFSGVLSFLVFTVGQLGISMIWSSSKDEVLVIFEQLCDKVKFDCMKSIFASPNPSKEDLEYRANLEKDVSFMRTAIDDLRRLEASNFTLSAVAKLFAAAILPFIPLIIMRLLG